MLPLRDNTYAHRALFVEADQSFFSPFEQLNRPSTIYRSYGAGKGTKGAKDFCPNRVRREKHPAIDSNKEAMPAATDTRVLPRRQFPPYTFRSWKSA
jgi:hypothetical protein